MKFAISPASWNRILVFQTLKYFIFILYGFVLALMNTQDIRGVIHVYVAILMWMGLVLLFLTHSREPAIYHINLIRLFYVHVAFLGLLFYIIYGFLGVRTTLFSTYAWNNPGEVYDFLGLSLSYSISPWFSRLVPRYTFLFQEPRIIGAKMPMALFLQLGFIKYASRASRKKYRTRAIFALVGIFACMFVIHSLIGYLSLALAVILILAIKLARHEAKVVKTILTGSLIVCLVVGLLAMLTFLVPGRVALELDVFTGEKLGWVFNLLEDTFSKTPGVAAGYTSAMASGFFNLYYYPFGSGWLQPIDQQQYYSQYGISVTGGFSLVESLIVHGGVLGVLFFIYIVRITVRALKATGSKQNVVVKYFLIAVAFTFLVSIIKDISGLSASFFLNMFLVELILIEFRRTQAASAKRRQMLGYEVPVCLSWTGKVAGRQGLRP